MFNLFVTDAAKADLQAIRAQSQDEYDDLVVFLEELRDDRSLIDHLAEDGEWTGRAIKVDVRPFAHLQGRQYDIWRVKTLGIRGAVSRYRIIYAVHNVRFDFYVCAVMKRDPGNDYEQNPDLLRRLYKLYLDLKLPFKG